MARHGLEGWHLALPCLGQFRHLLVQVQRAHPQHVTIREEACSEFCHKQAVIKRMGADASGGGATPPAEHFIDVWGDACKHDRAGNGPPKTGKRERTDKLIWCFHEAPRREDQDILHRVDVLTLVRDARKGRLLCGALPSPALGATPASLANPRCLAPPRRTSRKRHWT